MGVALQYKRITNTLILLTQYKVIPATKTYEIKSWEDKETGKIYIKGDKKRAKNKNFEITVK